MRLAMLSPDLATPRRRDLEGGSSIEDFYKKLSCTPPEPYLVTPEIVTMKNNIVRDKSIVVMQEQLNECTLKDIPKDADRRFECSYRLTHDFVKLEVPRYVGSGRISARNIELDGQILKAVEQNPRASVPRIANWKGYLKRIITPKGSICGENLLGLFIDIQVQGRLLCISKIVVTRVHVYSGSPLESSFCSSLCSWPSHRVRSAFEETIRW
ncbi:hypothetical protein NQ318_011740 [Aromia moschata]|uniref:Uncharacterized protein n=1 Tax=Aromia moschata TaxID=1265417 RepID=A0AAV8XLC9_9CUCU|nr:hypothetical protein NQ318_011740 [Aromia moschata]